ncbi:hypothetical protein SLA2020_356330, partial [Shorea laevis]
GDVPNSSLNQLRYLPYFRGLKEIYIEGDDVMGACNPSFSKAFYGHTSLGIENLDGLESLYPFIRNLKVLTIKNCENIKSLPDKLQDLNSLDKLHIGNCPGIESIRAGGLPLNLTSLQIDNCPGIESIPDCGFPPNLRKLTINCENLKKPMQEWGLSSLTSLLTFEIHWICPPDNVLPTSLTRLVVRKVENMKFIPRGLLQNLSSLQDLEIWDWPKLQRLPKEALPASLQMLRIWRCNNFQSLPNKVLPPSLQRLFIHHCRNFQALPKEGLPPLLERLLIICCPLLQRRCMEEIGDYWPLIAHIPLVWVELTRCWD